MKRRRRKEKTIPEDISVVINSILRDQNAQTNFKNMRLLMECKKRIGEDFAQHLRPDRIINGVLYCVVDSPSWVQQYQFFSAEMLRRVNTPPLEEEVLGIRFTVGRLDESPYLSEDSARDDPSFRRLRARLCESEFTLSPDDIRTLEKSVLAVHPKLRDDARTLVENWLAFMRSMQDEEGERKHEN
jgi:hypothetical protein